MLQFVCFIVYLTLSINAVAGFQDTEVKFYNRSMRDVRYKVIAEYDECAAGKLRPKESKLHAFLADSTEGCNGKSYYRFLIEAQKRNGELITNECTLYPDMVSRHVMLLWDGVRCFLKDE